MKTKILSLFLLTVFLCLAFASATELITVSKGPILSKSNTETYFDITGISDSNITISNPVLQIDDGKEHFITITLSPSTLNDFELTAGIGNKKTINASVLVDSGFDFNIDVYDFPLITIDATTTDNTDPENPITTTDTKTVKLQFLNSFCKYGENGTDLVITDINIDNNDGQDDEWSPLDEVTIDVDVTNEGIEKIRDVIVELGLYDTRGKNVVKELDDLNDRKISLGNLADDEEDTATFTFKIPADFKDEDYRLVVKAYSDDAGEDEICTSEYSDFNDRYYEIISGKREEDKNKHIVLDNIRVTPATVQCKEMLQISGEVVNIGDEDYQDQVKVSLNVPELDINLEKIIRKDFDQGDSKTIDFEFEIPKDADEREYFLRFRTFYDYDNYDDSYDLVSDDEFIKPFIVKGECKQETTANVQITATLDSETPEAIAGKQVIIKGTLTNIGEEPASYSISVLGNSAWSSLVSIMPQILELDNGESKDFNIVLNIDEETQGNQEFTIRTTYGEKITEQKVALSVIKENLQKDRIIEHLKRNWFIYAIILINIILVIAIIAVIKRMVSPAPAGL